MKTLKRVSEISAAGTLPVSTRMWNSKKAFMPLVTMGLMLIGVGVVGFFALKGLGIIGDNAKEQTLTIAESDVVMDSVTGEVKVTNCGADKDTSFDIVAFNPLDDDGTPTYHAVAFKAQDGDGGALKSYTTDADGTFAGTSLSLNCPASYDIYAPASKNATASAMFSIDTATPNTDRQVAVEQLDHITIYAYDEKNRGFVYDASDAVATDGEELIAAKTFKSTTNNATAYAMGTGSNLDFSFTVYTGATQRSWGDLKNYVIVDADKSDFGTPSMYWNGAALTEVGKAALKTDDAAYLSAYEYVFALSDDITEVQNNLRLKVNAKSGQNPDVDVKVRFVSESLYVDGTDIKQGIFNAGGTEVLMTPAQEVTLDIS